MSFHIPSSLHYRQFRLLWLGLMVSVSGSQMQTWSLFWHIRTLTEHPIALGGVGVARIVPIIVFSLLGGAIADVVNRRNLLFLTQTIMTLTAVGLAILTLNDQITIWHIYLLTAIQASAAAFDTPARQSLVPNLVPKKELTNAFSMSSLAFQVGAIAGPALSGLVIAYLGQSYTYIFNAISYGAVLVALVLMGNVHQDVFHDRRNNISLQSIKYGIDYILGQPIILSSMILDFFATFFSSANTLMPIFTRDILKVGAVEYGWLSAAQSIGAVTAAAVISQIENIKRQGKILLGSVIVFGIATIFFGATRVFLLAMFALMIIGAADSVSMIIRNTIRQLQTPDYVRGRMTSINQIFFMGGPQLGEIEAGVVAQLFGAPFAIITGGIGCILAVLYIGNRWKQLRFYNGDEPILAGVKATAD
jgi:MFS family permease